MKRDTDVHALFSSPPSPNCSVFFFFSVQVQLELPDQELKFQLCHLRPGKVDQFHTQLQLEGPAVLSLAQGWCGGVWVCVCVGVGVWGW